MAGTSKIHSFFVTNAAGEGGGISSGGTCTTWTDSSGVRPTLDNPADRAIFQLGTLLSQLRSAILHHGLCRPKGPIAISSENGNRRIFSETHYHAHSGAMEIERQWLSFLPTTKSHLVKDAGCWAIHRQMQKEWVNGVSGKPKNFGVKIKSILHEVGRPYIYK